MSNVSTAKIMSLVSALVVLTALTACSKNARPSTWNKQSKLKNKCMSPMAFNTAKLVEDRASGMSKNTDHVELRTYVESDDLEIQNVSEEVTREVSQNQMGVEVIRSLPVQEVASTQGSVANVNIQTDCTALEAEISGMGLQAPVRGKIVNIDVNTVEIEGVGVSSVPGETVNVTVEREASKDPVAKSKEAIGHIRLTMTVKRTLEIPNAGRVSRTTKFVSVVARKGSDEKLSVSASALRVHFEDAGAELALSTRAGQLFNVSRAAKTEKVEVSFSELAELANVAAQAREQRNLEAKKAHEAAAVSGQGGAAAPAADPGVVPANPAEAAPAAAAPADPAAAPANQAAPSTAEGTSSFPKK